MKHRDRRVAELFHHVREAIDLLEDIGLHPFVPAVSEKPKAPEPGKSRVKITLPTIDQPKLAYSVKEIRTLIGIGTATIYQAMAKGELRAMKYGKKTVILSADLQAWIDSWSSR